MKYNVRRFKSLAIALKELEKFFRNQRKNNVENQIRNGEPIEQFGGLRPREVCANWLICAVINAEIEAERLTFLTDPFDGDGVIWDSVTEQGWPTEHVIALNTRSGQVQNAATLILDAIAKKNSRGASYASGKNLIVLVDADGGGPWFPNRIAKQLPEPLHFETVWVIALQPTKDGQYVYNVAQLDRAGTPIRRVHIAKDFGSWQVEHIQ